METTANHESGQPYLGPSGRRPQRHARRGRTARIRPMGRRSGKPPLLQQPDPRMARNTAAGRGLRAGPRPAVAAVAATDRNLRNSACGPASETSPEPPAANGHSCRRGSRRDPFRNPRRPLPLRRRDGGTAALRLRRQVAGAALRRLDGLAPRRIDAHLRRPFRRRGNAA